METEENALIEQADPDMVEERKWRYLTSQQELEKKQVQKMKLRGKDRMAEILKEHKSRLNK